MCPRPLRIFVAEPDQPVREVLVEALSAEGFIIAEGPEDCAAAVVGEAAECRALRAASGELPIVLLARGGESEPAADAVLAKPVRLALLVARLRELIERPRRPAVRRIGPWSFDAARRLLSGGDGREVRLTDKETAILGHLAAATAPVPRDTLLAEVWGYAAGVTTHTLETHIYRLRRKLGPGPLLVTENGGYRLAE